MQTDTKYSIPTQVMSRQVGDETVLLDLATGIYFGLDSVGKTIWESISAGRSLDEIVANVTTEFEVDEQRARNDCIAFAAELVERGLLETS